MWLVEIYYLDNWSGWGVAEERKVHAQKWLEAEAKFNPKSFFRLRKLIEE